MSVNDSRCGRRVSVPRSVYDAEREALSESHKSEPQDLPVGVDVDPEIETLMRSIAYKAASLESRDQKLEMEIQKLWEGFDQQYGETVTLREENEKLLDMVENLQDKVLNDMLERARDTLTYYFMGYPTYSIFDHYFPLIGHDQPTPSEALYEAARQAIPNIERKAQIPAPVYIEPMWKMVVKGKLREGMRLRKAARKWEVQLYEATLAQRVLPLLKDEKVMQYVLLG